MHSPSVPPLRHTLHMSIHVHAYTHHTTLTVRAEIITPPLPHITVTTGNAVNLTCTARGSDIDLEWTFRGKSYSSTQECLNGVCVYTELSSNSPPLTKTSRLSLSGIETSTVVACTVVQNLLAGFSAGRVSSNSTVTVVEESHTTAGTFITQYSSSYCAYTNCSFLYFPIRYEIQFLCSVSCQIHF